jgi:hypothetical protein
MSANQGAVALSGITELALEELTAIFGGATYSDGLRDLAAAAGLVAGAAGVMGAEPVAIGAGIVAGAALLAAVALD